MKENGFVPSDLLVAPIKSHVFNDPDLRDDLKSSLVRFYPNSIVTDVHQITGEKVRLIKVEEVGGEGKFSLVPVSVLSLNKDQKSLLISTHRVSKRDIDGVHFCLCSVLEEDYVGRESDDSYYDN